jgi:phosphate acyltransferase
MTKRPNERKKPIVGVDAMGGDFAPVSEVEGALLAREAFPDIDIVLVGRRGEIEKTLGDREAFTVHHAEDVVEMHEAPVQAVRSKPDSSLVRGMRLLKEREIDAFVSAGNTGATLAAGAFVLGRTPGVERPTMGSVIPTIKGVTMIFDVGAAVDSKANHLVSYAAMGSVYFREILGVENPSIALLSVGEERSKGSDAVKTAYAMLEQSDLNFVGNVEGRDVLSAKANVVVCDGFTGNILLKFAESIPAFLKDTLRGFAETGFLNKLKAGFMAPTLKKMFNQLNYEEHGGVPLLGVDGVAIIGHGSGSPKAVANMIRRAKEMVEADVVRKISDAAKRYEQQEST